VKKAWSVCILILLVAAGLAAEQSAVLTLQDALKILPEFQWDPFLQTGTFYCAGHYASFKPGSKGETGYSLVDGYALVKTPSPYIENGALRFPQTFVSSVKKAIDAERALDLKPFRVAAVIIDPGHGGKDAGTTASHVINGRKVSLKEKDITLQVGIDLRRRLEERYPDKQILMTRSTNATLVLNERTSFANAVNIGEHEAIIFISIHCNSEMNPHLKRNPAKGYEIWYLPPQVRRDIIEKDDYDGPDAVRSILNTLKEEEFTYESRLLASTILKRFDQFIMSYSPSRGVKEEEWYVVKRANMPSVLVELAFLSNAEDAALLIEDESLARYTDALFHGIADFITLYEQPGGFSVIE
jgi:N-acetylmuramoyl-L-alanine amidase